MEIEWTPTLTIVASNIAFIGSNIALVLWARSESRQDYRECRNLVDAIHLEIKDFHGRLCSLEERRKNDNQKRRK
jgi:hypothetical protein